MELAARIGTMAEICGCGLKVIAPLENSNSTGNNRKIETICFSGLLEPNTFYVLVKIDAPIPDNALLAFETDESASIKYEGIRYRSSAYNIFPVVSKAAYDCVVRTTWRYVAFSK